MKAYLLIVASIPAAALTGMMLAIYHIQPAIQITCAASVLTIWMALVIMWTLRKR